MFPSPARTPSQWDSECLVSVIVAPNHVWPHSTTSRCMHLTWTIFVSKYRNSFGSTVMFACAAVPDSMYNYHCFNKYLVVWDYTVIVALALSYLSRGQKRISNNNLGICLGKTFQLHSYFIVWHVLWNTEHNKTIYVQLGLEYFMFCLYLHASNR